MKNKEFIIGLLFCVIVWFVLGAGFVCGWFLFMLGHYTIGGLAMALNFTMFLFLTAYVFRN